MDNRVKPVRQSGRTTRMFAEAAEACESKPRVIVIMAKYEDIVQWRLRCDHRIILLTQAQFGMRLFNSDGRMIYEPAKNEAIFIDHRISERSGVLADRRRYN